MLVPFGVFADALDSATALSTLVATVLAGAAVVLVVLALFAWLTVRRIPNEQVGLVEKLWSPHGTVPEGSIIALAGEAGYQADMLRGGIHLGLWRWQYRIHKVPLVAIPQGKIGYVYARDGEPLPPGQTIGRVVECSNFQDGRAFLTDVRENGEAAPGASAAGSAVSCARASMPSTRRSSS